MKFRKYDGNIKVIYITVANLKKLPIYIVIYQALCFDVAQGRMNGAPNETRTHSCRFASLAATHLYLHAFKFTYIYITLG